MCQLQFSRVAEATDFQSLQAQDEAKVEEVRPDLIKCVKMSEVYRLCFVRF